MNNKIDIVSKIQTGQRRAIYCRILLCLILISQFVLLISCTIKTPNTSENKKYHILVVFSYGKECAWTGEQYAGVVNCLKERQIAAEIDSFHLDAVHMRFAQECDTLTQLLNHYEKNPPDLILTCDDQATFSLLSTNHPLTYQVPIVFSGVDYVNNDSMKDHTNITGLTTLPDYQQCYRLAKQLFGDITKIGVITNDSYLGVKSTQELCKQLSELPNLHKIVAMKKEVNHVWLDYDTTFVHPQPGANPFNIEIQRLDELTGGEMKIKLQYEPGFVFVMPYWSNIYSEFTRLESCLFLMVNNEGFGDGRLGGYMTPSYDQTYEATKTGIRILREGLSPVDIPVLASKQVPMFDWRYLEKLNITLDTLPEDSVIINMPFTERYKTALWAGGVSLGTCLFIILLSIHQLYKVEKTNKRNILHALLKEQNELNITMESISEAVISIDHNGRIFAVNQAALNWLQLTHTQEEYVGKEWHDLLNIQVLKSPDYFNNLFRKVYQTNDSYTLDSSAYLVAPDGSSFPISGSISAIHSENSWQGAIITFRNTINETTQKEFLALSSTAGDIFAWQYDKTRKVFIYDHAFFRFMQWPEEETDELPVDSFLQRLHPDDLKGWEDTLQIVSAGKRHHSVQLRLRTNKKDGGEYCWWEYRIVSLSNRQLSDLHSLFGLCLNIDYLKEKERELKEARDLAFEADRQKGIFLSNMSHEVRTPLNVIVGFSEILTEPEELTLDEQKQFIDLINANCYLLLNLVNDILDISRIESGITFKQEACELNAMILGLIEENKAMIAPSVEIRHLLSEGPVTILSDRFRLRQILTNLLSNAIKFTMQGSITIGYQPNLTAGTIHFFVQDTGHGIPLEEQEKVFERFYKSDNFTQGGGLGLPICHEIVRRMNGTLTLESELGKGTCFYIVLPSNQIKEEETL